MADGVAALQTEYSLWCRDAEAEILPVVRELGVGFVAYSPLGRGFLTGQFKTFGDLPSDDYRRNAPRFQGENFRCQSSGTKRLEDLEDNLGAVNIRLTREELARIDSVLPVGAAAGPRYHARAMQAIDQ